MLLAKAHLLEGFDTMTRRALPPSSKALRCLTPRVQVVLALGALTLAPRPASARPVFTDWVNKYVQQGEAQPRNRSVIDRPLCHDGADRAQDFLERPFTIALRTESNFVPLTAQSRTTFMATLAALDEKKSDADCDGYPDLDEIRANFSPNDPNSHPREAPVETACFKPELGPPPQPQPQPEPQPEPEPEPGDDDDDDNRAAPSSNGSSCAYSAPARPLDLSAFFVAGLVALPLIRRALRPRKRPALPEAEG